MSNNVLLDNLQLDVDSVLAIRGQIGAVLKKVQFLTRTWSGTRVGDGSATDVVLDMFPAPAVKEFGNDLRIVEGGMVKQGDNLLSSVSKQSYPNESDIDCTTSGPLVEKFYIVGGKIHTVINVKEKYLTWDILVRERADQTRY